MYARHLLTIARIRIMHPCDSGFKKLWVYVGAWAALMLGVATSSNAQVTYYQDSDTLAGFGPNQVFLWNTTFAWSWNTDATGNSPTGPWINAVLPNNAVLGNGSGTGAYTGILGENISVGTITTVSGTWGISLGAYTLTLDSSADWNLGSALNGAGSVIKAGSGTVTVSSVNNYSGGTTISGGSIHLVSANTNVGPVTVNPTGTLQLGSPLAVPTTTSLSLAGGMLELTGAFSHTFDPPLALTGGGEINFGLGLGASTISFGSSIAQSWVGSLTISNYTSGSDALRFGSDGNGLSLGQLAVINFTGFDNGAMIDDSGFVTPVPEPSTYAAIIGGIALAFGAYRRRTANHTSESLISNQ